jgi:RNase H-fold protein (predicted Holliday junction resolvase)
MPLYLHAIMKYNYSEIEMALLAKAFKRSVSTISRWIVKQDDRLQSDKARETLKKAKAFKI